MGQMITLACSSPSISVSRVERSLSPTVMLVLELPPLSLMEKKNIRHLDFENVYAQSSDYLLENILLLVTLYGNIYHKHLSEGMGKKKFLRKC